MRNLLTYLMTNQVKKALISIAEFAVQQLASAIALHLIEMRRREATKKINSGENNVQLLGESVPNQQSSEQASGLRVVAD